MLTPSTARAVVALALISAGGCRSSTVSTTIERPTSHRAVEPSPVEAQRAWWRSFADGDTLALHGLSASGAIVTLSNARTFVAHDMFAESLRYRDLPHPELDWSDTAVVHSADRRVALVTARVTETDARGVGYFRSVTVLERDAGSPTGWRVLGAQSTREPQRYARLSAAAAGDLAQYAGQYRVPNGIVRVGVQDSALVLTDPRGGVTRLEPVGPALFEAVPPAGVTDVVRLLFSRDAAGQVSAMSRLTGVGLTTFLRVPLQR